MAYIDIVTKSRANFFFFVTECNDNYRSGHDLALYREIISRHRETPDLAKLLETDGFINLIRRTLAAWNMDQRAAELENEAELERSILQHKGPLLKLYKFKLHELDLKSVEAIKNTLELVFGGLSVMESKRRIVGVSKTLHFLLPDLIMPIDSKYTMNAFFGYNKYSRNLENELHDFVHIFIETIKISNKLNLTNSDVTGGQWNTSIPKLIDNAIIGCSNMDRVKLKEKLKFL
jgi:hypothetical protein